jgi:GT2 family glycosyltransferase
VTSALVVICTKDRPVDLAKCLGSLFDADAGVDVLVIDAGADERSLEVCRLAPQWAAGRLRRIAMQPGLSTQRNRGVAEALAAGVDVVVFLDDDVVAGKGAISALVDELERHPTLAAAGAVIVNEPKARAVAIKSVFALWSYRPGVVLPSGRNVIGHRAEGRWPRKVEWLATCTIAFRLSLLADLRFDERLVGYSYGEDLDLTYRLSRSHPLSVTREAQVWHYPSSTGRPGSPALARRRVQLLHAWVVEMQYAGLRRRWFWWSVFGEALLLAVRGLAARKSWAEAKGVVAGALDILRHGSSRSAPG